MSDGFSPCGVMDDYSFYMANKLLGNDPNAAAIEMTLSGITAEFLAPCEFIAAGGDFGGTLNGKPFAPNTVMRAEKGDTVAFSAAKTGCRAYFAVSGGFDVPELMGSRSTDIKCKIGGYLGRRLMRGDEIAFFGGGGKCAAGASFANPMPENCVEVRAVQGPQDNYFTAYDLSLFFSREYTLTPESDRMGMRLSGTPLKSVRGTDIVSDGIAAGSVQVPSSGQPVVLMADRQTTGGYAKIACVITCDLHLLAQTKPSSKIRFIKTDIKSAQEAVREYRSKLL